MNELTFKKILSWVCCAAILAMGSASASPVDDAPTPSVVPGNVIAISGKPTSKGAAHGERAYKRFTQKGKQDVKTDNARKHGGENHCEDCGVQTAPSQQSQKGVTPPKNETQVDHVIPRAKGGDGSPDNGQVLCRDCNNKKGDKQ